MAGLRRTHAASATLASAILWRIGRKMSRIKIVDLLDERERNARTVHELSAQPDGSRPLRADDDEIGSPFRVHAHSASAVRSSIGGDMVGGLLRAKQACCGRRAPRPEEGLL